VLAFIALWGCGVTLLYTKMCLCPFAVLLIFISIPMLIIGGAFVLQAGSYGFMSNGCELANTGQFDKFNFSLEESIFRQIKEVDDQIASVMNVHMCTDYCPC
jgi:hypothetical protein